MSFAALIAWKVSRFAQNPPGTQAQRALERFYSFFDG